MTAAPWVVVYDGTRTETKPYEHHCLRCGARYAMTLPVEVSVFVAAARAFLAAHRRCRARAA